MKKNIAIFSIVAMMVVVYSCRKNTAATAVSSVTIDATPYSYFTTTTTFVLVDSLNKVASLGRVLFYDGHLSVNNAIACASCHKQANAFADNTAFSTGFEGVKTRRNSIAINMVSNPFGGMTVTGNFFWDGREDNLNNLALRPISNHVEMGIDNADILPKKLAALPYYNKLFIAAFHDDNITMDRISSAISVFMQSITSSGSSRFDQFSNGNAAALTEQEKYGKTLFDTKYPCGSCHNSDSGRGGGGYTGGGGIIASFKDIGLDANYTDNGRGVITGQATDNGTFKVPNLRNVALTAPYMHDGRYKTLGDVIDHYSHNIQGSSNLDFRLKDSGGHSMTMNITAPEKEAIIAFLNTLTDYHLVTDPKFSNPFKVN